LATSGDIAVPVPSGRFKAGEDAHGIVAPGGSRVASPALFRN
jgi:hypothetical protein